MPRIAILVVLGALMPVVSAAADLDVRALIAAAPPATDFPGEDVVVLWQDESIVVDAAGRVVRRVHSVQRLQTQWAMRSRSDVRVAWDASRQDLTVLTARTFMVDGTEVATPPNGLNEVTPDAVSRAAPFLDVRELVISHIATEPGCVVELAYEVRDREPAPLPPSGVCWLGGEFPVLEARASVQGARAQRGDLAGPDTGTSEWLVREVPALRAEGSAAWRRAFTPHVVWTTLADVAHLARELRRTSEAGAGTADRLAAWLDRARADQETLTPVDLVQRLAALGHDGIDGVHLPGGAWTRPPRLAEDVYATAVGTDWERAVLALAVLRLAGHRPELGFFARQPLDGGALVDAGSFERFRVVVRVGDENWWLAPERAQAWTGPCDLAGWTGLILAADGGERVFRVPDQPGACRWSVNLAPAADGTGWTATGDLVLSGPYRDPDAEPAKLAEQRAARLLGDGKVASLDVRTATPQELSLRLTATGSLAVAAGDIPTVRDLPWPQGSLLDHLPGGFHAERPVRSTPLWVEQPGREESRIRIEVPAGWSVDQPVAGRLDLAGALATFAWSCRREGNVLELSRTLVLGPGRVEPQDYPALREVLAAALTNARQPLVILAD